MIQSADCQLITAGESHYNLMYASECFKFLLFWHLEVVFFSQASCMDLSSQAANWTVNNDPCMEEEILAWAAFLLSGYRPASRRH